MYSEDQDEDVEEEEEFHEVEEEKHKTSQESVGTPSGEQQPVNVSPLSQDESSSSSDPQKECSESSEEKSKDDVEETEPSSQQAPKIDQTEGLHVSENKEDTEVVVAERVPSPASTLQTESTEAEQKDGTTAVIPHVPESDKTEASDEAPATVGINWANMMMHNSTNECDSARETSQSDKPVEDNPGESQSSDIKSAEDTIDGIVEETQAKLRITDDDECKLDNSGEAVVEKANTIQADASNVADNNAESDQVPKEAVVEESPSGEHEKSEDGKGDQEKVDEVEKKELDLDEDVKNPQYIPKKGVFYEHDDRSHDTDEKKAPTTTKEAENVEVKETNASKKSSNGDKPSENRRNNRRQRTDADRWGHDLFRNEKQKPKSKSELIHAYGYDIRQERSARNSTENRTSRNNSNNNNNGSHSERAPGNQDGQRSRQSKDSRGPRQVQANNDSRERKPRRPQQQQQQQQQPPQTIKTNRIENISQAASSRRDGQIIRPSKVDATRDLRETLDEKHAAQAAASSNQNRRDREGSGSNRNVRNDSRGRRRTSRDRPNADEARLPPPNSVMPPITTWSSEDMMIAEAFGKKSPPQADTEESSAPNSSTNTNAQRPVDGWNQGPPSKPVYQDRSVRNHDDNRYQHNYNNRGRYQERGDENHRQTQFAQRNQYHDRSNQQHEWHRATNFSPYAKSNDYVVRTQTFENSRLSQNNHNRSNNNRDLRDIITERRANNQQTLQNKVQHNAEHMNHRGPIPGHYQYQYTPTQHYMPPHHQQMAQGQSHAPQQAHHQPTLSQLQQSQRSLQQSPHHSQATSQVQQQQHQQPQHHHHHHPQQQQQQQQNSHAQQSRQPTVAQPTQSVTGQTRQNLASNSVADSAPESVRSNTTSASDSLNSRPIVKTDTYTGGAGHVPGHQQHTQNLTQHSHNHRSMGGPMAQAGAVPAGSHIVPSHLGAAATQPTQYYQPSGSGRDPTATLASAYHGYMPGGHPVMDPSRYHMTSQQLADHGAYIAPDQTGDVAAGPVLHQQGLYADTSGTGAMATTAYLPQAGSSLSPTTNIPVTGAGTQPLPPVSYMQHSQYPPPPYTNPYSQPQMNQHPPQSGHPYPYWTYI